MKKIVRQIGYLQRLYRYARSAEHKMWNMLRCDTFWALYIQHVTKYEDHSQGTKYVTCITVHHQKLIKVNCRH